MSGDQYLDADRYLGQTKRRRRSHWSDPFGMRLSGEFGGGAARLRGFPVPSRHGLPNANCRGIKRDSLPKAEKKHQFTIFPFVIPLEVSHFVNRAGASKGQATNHPWGGSYE